MTANEADIDKFATLFSPGTPRASPTQANVSLPPTNDGLASKVKHYDTLTRRNTSIGSADDFGAFVSVSASEDPLASFDPLGDEGVTTSSTTSTTRSTRRTSTSLSFFDKFAHDAKLASERKQKGVLDELLLHEDDPLYWLKDPGPSSQAQEEPITKDDTEFGEMVEGTEAALIDLNFDESNKQETLFITRPAHRINFFGFVYAYPVCY
ncbi:hypothetical protein ONZ45_g14081 [Pleurotus djamor]|nr:hypothetical protein ONZ45_g14081 [Pleurotus djamor]